MSALLDMFAAICTKPDVERAALSHDTTNPEYRRLFGATCRDLGVRVDEDEFPDVTDPREPDLPGADLGITTPSPTEF